MPATSTPARRLKRGPIIVALIVLAVVLMVWKPWRPSPEEFRQADPHGYQACYYFDQADGAGGNVYRDAIGLSAQQAVQASTPEIRKAADDRRGGRDGDPVIRDLSDMRDACENAGYRQRN